MGCLYMLTGPLGKSYIGITSRTAAWRFKWHYYADTAIGSAIRKVMRAWWRNRREKVLP